MKAEPTGRSKRQSPMQAVGQPAAKRGRLLKQQAAVEAASTDSDETMEECVSPSRLKPGRKSTVESDDDEDYVMPGQLITCSSLGRSSSA